MKQEQVTAVILAAGTGKRMNSRQKKQYLMLQGHPVLYYSIKAFEESCVDRIILVTGAEEFEFCRHNLIEAGSFQKVTELVAGGKERYHSVYAGLKAASGSDYVLIHDGARPFVTETIIARTLEGARKYGACAAGVRSKDTIKLADEADFSRQTPDRSKVWAMQTPQTFSYELIFEAYRRLIERENKGEPVTVTDDAMVAELMMRHPVKLTEGSYENFKITTPVDLLLAQAQMQAGVWTQH